MQVKNKLVVATRMPVTRVVSSFEICKNLKGNISVTITCLIKLAYKTNLRFIKNLFDIEDVKDRPNL